MRKRLGRSAGGRGHKRVLVKGGGWLEPEVLGDGYAMFERGQKR